MKEQIGIVANMGYIFEVAKQTTSTPRMVDDLTTSAQRSYPRVGGVFMDQGNSEQPSISQKGSLSKTGGFPSKVIPSEGVSTSPFAKSPDKIQNIQLRDYAKSLNERMDKKPLGSWTVEELRKEYLELHRFSSTLEDQTKAFRERERIASQAQPYNQLIMQELENRGEDLRELFLEATKKSAKEGRSTRSIGAAKADIPLLGYTEPVVQNIVIEIYNEIDRVGEGNPLSPQFVIDQLEQVRNIRNANPTNPTIVEQANRLLGNLNTWMAESTAAGAEPEARRFENIRRRIAEHLSQRPSDLAEREQLIREILDVINIYGVVEATGIPPQLLELASNFRELRESFINRILFRAFENTTETNDYRESMNLYAMSNLDTLLGYLRQKDPERYAYFDSLKTAASFFHTMNATLIAGNLDGFINIAQNINYQHFTLMKETRGVSEVMRLFEQKYSDYLARHKWISTEGYEEIKKEVENSFRFSNDRSLIESEFKGERTGENLGRMEEWELQRALNVGRTFFNITFRAAEQIASGQVPRRFEEGGTEGHKKYASFPQESATRIMNWIQWMTYRFEIAGTRGGLAFLDMVKERYLDFMQARKTKLGINKIEEFGGMKTEEIEYGAMFSVSGLFSSWRVENMAFSSIKIEADGRQISIRDWLDEVYNPNDPLDKQMPRVARIAQIQEEATAAIKRGKSIDRQQEEMLTFLMPLINNTNVGLGILLKHRILGEGVGYRARIRVWERVAENNLPLMINYLTGLKFKDNTNIPSLESMKDTIGVNWNEVPNNLPGETRTRWEIFMQKVLFNHERHMRQEVLHMDPNRGNIADIPGEQAYDDYEGALMESIRNAGSNLAPHLADIAFPYLPFMNDAPFELFDYTAPGHEFYKRRTGGDFPSFAQAEGAFTKIMTNPGGIGAEEGLKQFLALVQGIESPEGTTSAQEKVSPMFESWIDWIMTRPWKRQSVVKALLHLARTPTSLAQQYSDIGADSLDEAQTANALEGGVKAGIINMDIVEELKRKKNLKLGGFIWLFLRDVLLAGVLGGIVDFGKSTTKGLDQR